VLFGPLSEFLGRSAIYIGSFALFTILNIPVAFSQSIGVFITFRFFTGFAGSAFLSVAGGTVSDLFAPANSDIPVAIYTLAALIGPALGPIFGGFINQNADWRITFYVITGWALVETILLFFFVPETFLPIMLKNMARKKRVDTKDHKWWAPSERSGRSIGDVFPRAFLTPLQILFLERMAFILDMWTSLVLGIIYLFFSAVPFTFRTIYNFNLQSTGLAFIPLGLGMIIATCTQPFWAARVRDAAIKNGGKAPPEVRLEIGMAGALLVPIGLLWFALSSYAKINFIMPLAGTLIFGIGAAFVFSSVFGFLISTYAKNAASAMAGNTLIRCAWGAGFPLFSNAMYVNLGPVGATGLLAGLTALMIPIPFVIYRIGPRLRETSKFIPK